MRQAFLRFPDSATAQKALLSCALAKETKDGIAFDTNVDFGAIKNVRIYNSVLAQLRGITS